MSEFALEKTIDVGKRLGMSMELSEKLRNLARDYPAAAREFVPLLDDIFMSTSEVYTGLSRDSGERAPKRVKLHTSINKSEIVLTIGEVSVVGKGKMKIEFSKTGLYYTWKNQDYGVPFPKIETILKVPHPHKHKKQVLIIIVHKSMKNDKEILEYLVICLKETERVEAFAQPGLPHPQSGQVGLDWLDAEIAALTGVTVQDIKDGSISCHKSASEGFIYLSKTGILFLTKTVWIPIDAIARLEKTGGSRHAFDLQVELHPAENEPAQKAKLHEFMIPREVEGRVTLYISDILSSTSGAQLPKSEEAETKSGPNGDVENSEDDESSDEESDQEEVAFNAEEYKSDDDSNFEGDSESSCDEEYNSQSEESGNESGAGSP